MPNARPCAALAALLVAAASVASAQHVQVDVTHSTNAFSPLAAMGAGVDRDPTNLQQIYSASNVQQMLAAGWGGLSYRLNTELAVQAWHWNPTGTWSDPSGQGYFTGNAASSGPITQSWGYAIPHRGFTISGEPASALDDGDSATYWKSNPYLSHAFTGTPDSAHPQWVLFDLGSVVGVDAIRIQWSSPYATAYQVQHWTGDDAIYNPAQGQWQTFTSGSITGGAGGTVLLQLAAAPIAAQYIRVNMTASSDTCDSHGSSDIRNCVGYAIAEIGIGTLGAGGQFNDLVQHAKNADRQTPTYCSSDDPWHQPSNIYTGDGVQPGLDFILTGPLARALPAMVPVSLLYGTPDDAVAEIAYLKAKGYPILGIELGEEPDGQFVLPEDDAELYLQWAAALHRLDPALKLGGPVFQGVNSDIPVWPDAQGNTSWFNRFLNYLIAKGRLGDLAFMSFEHYPFNPCSLAWSRLYHEPALVKNIMKVWRADGLPANVPMYITEANIAYNTNESFMDIFGALWLADYTAAFLTAGGAGAFYYQYEPLPMYDGCPLQNSWGTFGMFTVDSSGQVAQQTAQFFAAQLLTQQWAEPVSATHYSYSGTSNVKDSSGDILVTAYALLRPDGQWSVLLVNKDQLNAHPLTVTFHNSATNANQYFHGTVAAVTFGSAQYQWLPNGANGSANPDGPPVESTAPGGPGAMYTLPAASITVLRAPIQ